MRIERIELHNYGSFQGLHQFQLVNRGLCLVLGDNQDEPRMNSNGSGKSTIFDALDWCLFGKVPRGDHVDSVINDTVGDDCYVNVFLADEDGTGAVVSRRRGKSSGLTFSVDGTDVSALDVAETQRHVERFLGLDRDVFHAAVLFAQTDLLRFADASDSDRMEVLTKILQLEEIDAWLELAKDARKAVVLRQEQIKGELNQRRGQIAMAAQQMPGLRAQADNVTAERASKLRETMVALTRHEENIPKYEAIIAKEPSVLASISLAQEKLQEAQMLAPATAFLGRPAPFDQGPYDVKTAEVRQVEQQWFAKRQEITADGQRVGVRLERFLVLGRGECSECGQEITADHVEREVVKLGGERDALRVSWQTADQEYQAAKQKRELSERHTHEAREVYNQGVLAWERQRDAHQAAQQALEGAVHAARAQLQEAQNQFDAIQREKISLKQTQDYVAELRHIAEDTRTKPNPYTVQIKELEALAGGVQSQIATGEKALAVEEEHIAYYDFWVEGFGPRGLKSYILDHRLQEMTEAANHWVKVLTGGTIWVRFETQTMGRSTKKLSNKINVRVFRYNPDGSISERSYRSWSGGEKQRVSLGVDFGLSRLIANRASKRYDLLILDELFRHLDQGGREAVIEMLHHLRREKSSVIVVDHDQTFQGAFENVVTVTKKNRCSVIASPGENHARSYEAFQSPAPQTDSVRAEAAVP